MTISDLLDLDILNLNKMSEKELRKIVSRMRDAGNKKIKRLQKSGYKTPALQQVERSGGLFSTKGKNINQLRSEYSRIRSFMTSKTSTATGYKKVRSEMINEFKKRGVDVNNDTFDIMIRTYDRLKEMDPDIVRILGSSQVQREISQMMDNTPDVEDLILQMQDRIEELYEQQAGINGDFDGTSEFFEI